MEIKAANGDLFIGVSRELNETERLALELTVNTLSIYLLVKDGEMKKEIFQHYINVLSENAKYDLSVLVECGLMPDLSKI